MLTITDIETLAAKTIEVLRSRATDAIRYCEAYEGTRTTIVVDGSQFSPSDRALPLGHAVWALTEHDHDAWLIWSAAVEDAIDAYELEADDDCDEHEMWSLHWEDGILWASLPELGD